ncbi:MAG: EAL domain-containing protein, partial [Phormidesmis sp.]
YEVRYRRRNGEVFIGETIGSIVKNRQGQTLGYLGIIRDISHHKQTETALRDSRARYRALYEKTPIMLHSVDAQGCIVDVSDYWLEKLGYNRPEVIGRKSTDFLTPKSQQDDKEAVLPKHFLTSNHRNAPHQIVTKTGKTMDVLLSALMERDEDGNADRTLSVMVDVTERNQVMAELRASEFRFQTFMNNSPNLKFVKEADTGKLVFINQTFETFFQIEASDLLGKTDFDWLPFDVAQQNRKNDLKAAEVGEAIQLTESVPDVKGVPQEWMVLKFPFHDINRKLLIGGIAVNVTEQKRLERRLHEERELAQVTLHSIGDAVITTDAAGMVTYLNPVAEKLTGWAQSQAQGLALSEVFIILNEHTREPVESPVTLVLREGKTVGMANHTILVAKDGIERGIDDSAAPIRDRDGTLIGTVLVFHDVTQTRQLASQLTWQVGHDELTHLVNRRQFEQELENVLRPRQKSGVLCYLDLDQFKLINDSCGHAAGDQLLQQIASILNQQVRESDTVARLGGDEFAILLRECSLTFAHQITNLMCQRIQSLGFVWENQTFSVGASIGLAEITSDSYDVTEIMASADAACYAAKAAGRNRVHIYRVDDASLSHQRSQQRWCLRIDQALEENRFRLYHQPIVAVDTEPDSPSNSAAKTYQHTEILLRLLDEQGQIVAPMAFIPAAERYHRMHLIDRWVIRQCLNELSAADSKASWASSKGLYNINLSGASLNDESFLSDLQSTLQKGDVDPTIICFEITETAAISNLHGVTNFMNALKQIGCRFALDDFGSGMSSFGYLRQLPVDYIKIDGSFIQNLGDPLNAAIVGSICHIGQAMNLEIIAESVESDAARSQLKALGVDYVQGFGIARPMPFSLLA